MKKAFPANIDGKIFYIDEDAYELLNNYLTQLREAFPGNEGKEIVGDIESRIRELFDESTASGQVIVLGDVNRVIETMGRPEQLSPDGSMSPKYPTPPPYCEHPRKRLYRDERDKVFGGVLSGLGLYTGWNVTAMRILAVIIACTTFFMPCAVVYIIAWIIIPPARNTRQILEMQGEPVTIGNVGQTVMDSLSSASGFFNTTIRMIGVCIMGFFGFCTGVLAFACVMVALCIIAGMICMVAGGGSGLLYNTGIDLAMPYLSGWGTVMILLAVSVPAMLITWAGCNVVFRTPPVTRTALIAALVLEVIFIIAASVLMNIGGDSDLADIGCMLLPVGMAITPAC